MGTTQFPNIRWRRTHSANEKAFLAKMVSDRNREFEAFALFLIKQGNPTASIQVKAHTVKDLNLVYASSQIINTTEVDWTNQAGDAYGFLVFNMDHQQMNVGQEYHISIDFTNYSPDLSNFFSTVFDFPTPHNFSYGDSPHNIHEYPKSIIPLTYEV
jgi:hypothetical protein